MPLYQEVSQGQPANGLEVTAAVEEEPDQKDTNILSKRPLLAAACSVGAVLAFVACLPQRSSLRSGPNSLELTLGLVGADEVSCSAVGENCLSSKCCVDGGSQGFTCYAKSDSWAECLPSCEKGVHKGEKHGTWDASGTFHLDSWSCEELGKRSSPACSAFDSKKECPSHRCAWKSSTSKCHANCGAVNGSDACAATDGCMWKGKCMEACSTFSDSETCGPSDKCIWRGASKSCDEGCWTFGTEDSCPKAGSCTWNGTLCMESCSTFGEDSCTAQGRCQWTGSECKAACSTFANADSCPHDLGCIWSKPDDKSPERCMSDPCSAPGEDCRSTKCCSSERGAVGHTCYQKDKYWAACSLSCGQSNDTKGWSCNELGERSKYPSGCAWAGNSCAADKLCCNDGFECVVKDDLWTACTQTVKRDTWVTHYIPIPAGWKGTRVGGGRREYALKAAPEGTPTLGTRLYCFMAILPDSGEVTLMQLAKRNKVSVFACDGYDVFHSWKSAMTQWDSGTATLTNTDVFIKIWDQVYDAGRFKDYDWTVKVDADAILVPERLRAHIAALHPPADQAIYLKNNIMDKGLGNNGFLGAVEVFSKVAILKYHDNKEGCLKTMGLQAGEDGFFKGCMDALGIGYMTDPDMFFPDISAGACNLQQRAAYHPLKAPKDWQCCLDIINGKPHTVEYGHCSLGYELDLNFEDDTTLLVKKL